MVQFFGPPCSDATAETNGHVMAMECNMLIFQVELYMYCISAPAKTCTCSCLPYEMINLTIT